MWGFAWPIVRAVLISRGLNEVVDWIERAMGGDATSSESPPTSSSQPPKPPSVSDWRDNTPEDLSPLYQEREIDQALSRLHPPRCPCAACGCRKTSNRHRGVYSCD